MAIFSSYNLSPLTTGQPEYIPSGGFMHDQSSCMNWHLLQFLLPDGNRTCPINEIR